MKNITEDQINKVIHDTFLTINDNIPSYFVKQCNDFKKLLDEDKAFSSDAERANATIYLAILKTVWDGCSSAIGGILQELLCDE